MGDIQECPICLKKHKKDYHGEGWVSYYCNEGKYPSVIDEESVFYEKSALDKCTDEEKQKRRNAIYNFVFQHGPYIVQHGGLDVPQPSWKFIYEENEEAFAENIKNANLKDENEIINVYDLMKNYPKDITTRVDKILLNLAKLNPNFLTSFDLNQTILEYPRLFYPDNIQEQEEDIVSGKNSIHKLLLKLKYIEDVSGSVQLSYEAWKRIEYLKENPQKNKNIFIAMSFNDKIEIRNDIEKAFKEAIIETGYTVKIIKDKEHNNYIMPEIFYEIEHAAGVVVDVTIKNEGAYYEAGYALGKNKEVIFCCRKKEFNRKKPHFDIAQKNMIIWENIKDLIDSLKRRIRATIQ